MRRFGQVFGIVAILVGFSVSLGALGPVRAASSDAAQTTVAQPTPSAWASTDPYIWLEDKDGPRAMAWVQAQNAKSLPVLQGDPHYSALYADALQITQAKGRIPAPSFLQGGIYNFWQDTQHVRGIWRRTSAASYATSAPNWSTVLDLDAVSKSEHANWVWEGAACNWPTERRCLVFLSNGGEDARTIREFDLQTRQFVPNGFVLPHGKQQATWEDANTLLVSREWKPGDLTTSGYAYIVKRLKRGQPLSSAVEIFRGQRSDVSASAFTLHDGTGHSATLIERSPSFFTNLHYFVTPGGVRQICNAGEVGHRWNRRRTAHHLASARLGRQRTHVPAGRGGIGEPCGGKSRSGASQAGPGLCARSARINRQRLDDAIADSWSRYIKMCAAAPSFLRRTPAVHGVLRDA